MDFILVLSLQTNKKKCTSFVVGQASSPKARMVFRFDDHSSNTKTNVNREETYVIVHESFSTVENRGAFEWNKPSCWYSNLWFSLKKNPSNDFTQMQILLIRSGVLNRARGFRILRQLFKHSNHSDVPFKHLNENKGRMKLQKHKQRKSSMLDQVRLNGHTTWFSDLTTIIQTQKHITVPFQTLQRK